MKNGYGYTIVFMLLVSIAFGAVLSLTQVGLSPRIARNALIAERRAILEALAEDTTGGDQAILDRFTSLVRPEVFAGLNAYALTGDDGSIDAYAVPFAGAGLWGTIRGYLAVTPDQAWAAGSTSRPSRSSSAAWPLTRRKGWLMVRPAAINSTPSPAPHRHRALSCRSSTGCCRRH
jgi:Na+-transporting NADH:ubiquinone oxidoreductase subunit NqrC